MLCWSLAWAQSAPRLPEVQAEVPAAFDPAQLGGATTASVLLTVTVGEDGRVEDVVVAEPFSPEIDAAVVAAMRDFRFAPAIDASGAPVRAAIQYRFQLTVDAVPTVSVIGVVRRMGTPGPFGGATVMLTGPDGAARTALTDAEGAFRLAGLAEGAWTIDVQASGYVAESATFQVAAGRVSEVTLYAEVSRPWVVEDVEVIEVISQRVPPEITERALKADEIRVLPGSGGDVVRAVQNLPGIGRAPLGIGQLIIRGAAPEDSRYSVDGMEIPLVFHFSGLTTVLASDLLDEVLFLPGNFGVRYGRNLGGRVDLRTKLAIPERTHGFVSVDVYQAAAFAEVRVNERTSVTLAARRSYIDAVLTPILSNDTTVFRAPRYYDAQLRVTHKLNGGGSIDGLVLFSDDRFVSGSKDENGDVAPAIGLATTFAKSKFRYEAPLGGGWRHELSLLVGPDFQDFQFGEGSTAKETQWAVDLREEVISEHADGGRLRMGIDLHSGSTAFLYDVPGFGPREEGSAWVFAPALYIEPTFVRGPVTVTPGLRTDLLSYGGTYTSWSVDPRLAARFRVGPTSTITAAVGRYTQFPGARQVLPEGDGTAGLKPPWALQSGIGLVQKLPYDLSLELNLYYNRMFGLVVGREDRFRFFTGPPPSGPFDTLPYGNDGLGMTCGTELLFKWQSKRGLAWLSGTFGRSFRDGRNDEDQVPFAYDQRFVINALTSYQLPKQWRLGARFRVSDGNPYTPVVQRILSLDDRGYIPVYGAAGSARLPVFFSLDLRFDKTWTYKKGSFTFFLDVQNVTNRRNTEVIGWSWDWAQEAGVKSLPILPVFGLRGDF